MQIMMAIGIGARASGTYLRHKIVYVYCSPNIHHSFVNQNKCCSILQHKHTSNRYARAIVLKAFWSCAENKAKQKSTEE